MRELALPTSGNVRKGDTPACPASPIFQAGCREGDGMTKDLINELLEQIKEDGRRFQKLRPWVVQYTSNRNKVSLDYDFNLGKIPMTLIASRAEWEKLDQLYLERKLTFESIAPFISIPKTKKKDRHQLKKYSKQDPDWFVEELKKCVDTALYELRQNKPRGNIKEQRDWSTRLRINRVSCQLYHYIKCHYRNNRRDEVLRLFKKYNFGNVIKTGRHIDFVMNVIEKEFETELRCNPGEFYRSYIRFNAIFFNKSKDHGALIKRISLILKYEHQEDSDGYYLYKILSNERLTPMKKE